MSKQRVRAVFLRKAEGDSHVISGAFLAVITMTAILLLMTAVTAYYSDVLRLSEIELIVRNHMLKAETAGYFSQDEVQVMAAALERQGLTQLRLSGNLPRNLQTDGVEYGTVYGRAQYGESIVIVIEGILHTERLENTQTQQGLFDWRSGAQGRKVTLRVEGVAVR